MITKLRFRTKNTVSNPILSLRFRSSFFLFFLLFSMRGGLSGLDETWKIVFISSFLSSNSFWIFCFRLDFDSVPFCSVLFVQTNHGTPELVVRLFATSNPTRVDWQRQTGQHSSLLRCVQKKGIIRQRTVLFCFSRISKDSFFLQMNSTKKPFQ